MKTYQFKSAVPVWEPDKEKEKNYNLVFRAVIDYADASVVCLAASNLYQMFVNGKMIAQGPARAGHGYYRVDEIDVSDYLIQGKNIIAIYVNSYAIKNFYLINQPGFLCAEVLQDGKVVAATGKKGFEAKYHDERLRYVGRFSSQRTFSEVYKLREDTYKAFETQADCSFTAVKLAPTETKKFIEREVPYPCYEEYMAQQVIAKGDFVYLQEPKSLESLGWENMDADLVKGQGFTREEAECLVSDELDKCDCTKTSDKVESAADAVLGSHEWAIFDMGFEKTGFITLGIDCEADAEIILSFDEVLTDGDVSTRRLLVSNGVVWFLDKGQYSLICNEPNAFRYLKVANNSEGAITIKRIGVVEFAFDYKSKGLGSKNEKLNRVYEAAIESFRQNTVDIYMDCPSRERAGWLCDSYFMSKVEYLLTGKSTVEKNFLENFIMAEHFEDVPEHMFAMCYPSDFTDQKTYHLIPNWAMWYVIELEEYLERTGDRALVEYAHPKIEKLYAYLESFRNSDGLLENLEKWVFVESSKANSFTDGVNYPSNMLYCKMLRAMKGLYGGDYDAEADEIAQKIREQSYDNGFFHDHAVRNEAGKLELMKGDVSEVCQYYAFFTGIATVTAYPELWHIVLHDFGPDREAKKLWSEIYPASPFIGYVLRLEVLEQQGESAKLLEDIEGYFYPMAQATNTLWETLHPRSSRNHGFGSVVAVWLDNKNACETHSIYT